MNSAVLANREILIDTSLVLLLVVGRTRKQFIEGHRKLQDFAISDYEVLEALIANCAQTITTAYILAESSNLYRQCKEPVLSELHQTFVSFAVSSIERTPSASQVVEHLGFPRLGAADAASLTVLQQYREYMLLTKDVGLYLAACELNLDAVNFTYLRNIG